MPIKKLKRLLSSPGTMTVHQKKITRHRQKCRIKRELDDMQLIRDSEDTKLKQFLKEEMDKRDMCMQKNTKLVEPTPDYTDDSDDGLDDDVKDMWENPSSVLGE